MFIRFKIERSYVQASLMNDAEIKAMLQFYCVISMLFLADNC